MAKVPDQDEQERDCCREDHGTDEEHAPAELRLHFSRMLRPRSLQAS